jgi:protein involved in polysaccharide export with SLBB domain
MLMISRSLARGKTPFVWVLWLAGAALLLPAAAHARRVAIPEEPLGPVDSTFLALEPYPYRICPGDELTVDYGLVLDNRPVTATVVVRPDGAVSLPRVGDVRVAGRSTAELDSTLAELYSDVYLNPSITVEVSKLAGNLVHVLGEVNAPGSYPIVPNATAMQAIAQAGGFRSNGSQGDVLVVRRIGLNKVAVRRVNMRQLLAGGKASGDMILRRNDIVFVNRTMVGDFKAFAENVLQPMITAAETYIRGWTVFHIDEIFTPGRVTVQP